MKILVLHLSDMHFGSTNNYQNSNVYGIVNALQQSIFEINKILILISGDLAHSGKREEYNQTTRFLNSLKGAIAERYSISDIQVLIVPGNHDIDYKKNSGDLKSEGLAQIEKDASYVDHIKDELLKQEEFYRLAPRYGCFRNGNILNQKKIDYDGKTIQINLINTAIFSSLDNDQGYHFICENDIERLKEQNESDYVFTVMHHPHHWYSEKCKKHLEEAIYSRTDALFVGHEHYASTQKITKEEESIEIFAAGKLCDQGDWTDSEFYVGVLDLDTRVYQKRKYHWNINRGIYEESENKEYTLSKNRFNKHGLSVKSSYLEELEKDKYSIASSIRDYFVFPLLVEERLNDENDILPKEINSMEEFWIAIEGKKKIIISGSSTIGKTSLARVIYHDLSEKRVSLYLDGQEIKGSFEGIIRDAFEKAYSTDRTVYEEFKQLPPDELAIIIDDIEAIEYKTQEKFIDYLSDRFGLIIETCHSEVDVDIKNRIKNRAAIEENSFYRVAQFYVDKRRELVTRLVRIIEKTEEESLQDKKIENLTNNLKNQKYLYSWNPDFIVQYVNYYSKNIGESIPNDGSIFSKVFENNLSLLLMPHLHNMSVDKCMFLLDRIAYMIFVGKHEWVSVSQIDEVIQKYNEDYDSEIDTNDLINELIEAKVLKKNTNRYKFQERTYLSYFTAREIRKKCIKNDYQQLFHVMNYSYSGVNADILLFLTYILEDPILIRMIMDHSLCAIDSWTEYDFKESKVPILVGSVEEVINPPTDEDVHEEYNKELEEEKKEHEEIIIANNGRIFDLEPEDLSYIQRVMRSVSLMIVLARALPSFEYMMEKDDKAKCVELIYKMPLYIFSEIVKSIDGESKDLIHQIKGYLESVYRKEKPKKEPVSDEEAVGILRIEVISMLLDLMNASMSNATKENTIVYLDKYPYMNSSSYQIEHIMSLSRRDDPIRFTQETIQLFEDSKQSIIRSIIPRIAKNYIVTTSRLKKPERDKLIGKLFEPKAGKYFDQKYNQARLLFESARNRSKGK